MAGSILRENRIIPRGITETDDTSQAFHHFDNPHGFVNECQRVLKKNGMVTISCFPIGRLRLWIFNR